MVVVTLTYSFPTISHFNSSSPFLSCIVDYNMVANNDMQCYYSVNALELITFLVSVGMSTGAVPAGKCFHVSSTAPDDLIHWLQNPSRGPPA